MAQKKSAAKKTRSAKSTRSRHEMIDTKTVDFVPSASVSTPSMPQAMNMGINIRLIVGLVVLALVALLVTNKGLLVAAVVDGRPIFRWDLNNALVSRFGQQTLESMISEQLIASEAKKAGIEVSQADIDAKVKEITGSLGENVKIEDLLKYQGMTKSDFENQIRVQLTIEKVLGKDVKISDEDVTNFIAENQATLVSTDEASLKKEAYQAILSQKISEKLTPWFNEVKAKASIIRFIK